MDPIISLLAPYGLPGIIIGYLLWDNHTTRKVMMNGMMSSQKDNTEVMTKVKDGLSSLEKSQDSTTRVMERVESYIAKN